MKFSKLVDIQESATLRMNALAMKKKREGQTVYNLTVGEPLVETDEAIVKAATEALERGETRYTPTAGIPELRSVCAQWMNQFCGASFSAAEVIVTCGGKSGLQMLCQAFIEQDDEAIIIAPYWVSYKSMVEMYGGVVRVIETTEEQEWKANVEDIEKLISSRTKLLFINNASNPTGVLYSKEELEAILSLAKKHGVLVISDEVYGSLVYDDVYTSCASFAQYKDSVAIVQSASKHFAMTGWRVGFVLAQEEIINKLTAIQGQSTSGTSSISQWAAVGAFNNAEHIIGTIKNTMRVRRDVFVQTFNELFDTHIAIPKSAFYCFISLKTLGSNEVDSAVFCERVLEEANVALVPGSAFGMEGYVRFSFGGVEKDIVAGLEALAAYVKK